MRPVYLSICSSDYFIVWESYCENAFVAFKTAVSWLRRLRKQYPDKVFFVYHKFCCRTVFGSLKERLMESIKNSEDIKDASPGNPIELVVPFITKRGKELRFIRNGRPWYLTDNPWENSIHPCALPYEYLFQILHSIENSDRKAVISLEDEFELLKREHASLRLVFK